MTCFRKVQVMVQLLHTSTNPRYRFCDAVHMLPAKAKEGKNATIQFSSPKCQNTKMPKCVGAARPHCGPSASLRPPPKRHVWGRHAPTVVRVHHWFAGVWGFTVCSLAWHRLSSGMGREDPKGVRGGERICRICRIFIARIELPARRGAHMPLRG